jgi:hypothetical protein
MMRGSNPLDPVGGSAVRRLGLRDLSRRRRTELVAAERRLSERRAGERRRDALSGQPTTALTDVAGLTDIAALPLGSEPVDPHRVAVYA